MGLGMQMLAWDEGFCSCWSTADSASSATTTATSAFHEVGGGMPNIIAGAIGMTGSARYTLREMAPTPSACSTTSRSTAPTSSAPRWAA